MFLHSILLVFLSAAVDQVLCAPYLEVGFDTSQKFGYDGPWYAVPVAVGSNEQPVHLFPGFSWSVMVISDKACGDTTDCVSLPGGLYNYDSDDLNYPGTIGFSAAGSDAIPYGSLLKANGTSFIQYSQLKIGNGHSRVTITNSSVARLDTISVRLGETDIGLSNGFLSLGAVDDAHVFTKPLPDSEEVIQYRPVIALNDLARTKAIASKSWGMHYASAALNQTPSLVWGGYDYSRIAGPVQRFDVNPDGFRRLELVGINIGTAVGKSPFDFEYKSNLLVIPSEIREAGMIEVGLETGMPYMSLPDDTCSAIAKELPMALDLATGFYLWDTEDPAYAAIVASPAYLSFDFRISPSQNFTIKVPFALLNLELQPPFVTEPKQYFPCKPVFYEREGSDNYVLGRAFHQAALVAHSWNQLKFWVAQAPGPDFANPDLRTIEAEATTLDDSNADDNTWIASWNSTWTVVPLPASSDPTPPSSESPSPSTSTSDPPASTGLSTGAMGGIGAGVGTVALLLIVGAVLYWRKKRVSKSPIQKTPSLIPLSPSNGYYDGAQGSQVKGYAYYPQQNAHNAHNTHHGQEERWELPENERPAELPSH